MTWANRYITWTCNEKVTNWEWSSTIFANRRWVATQQVRMGQVTVADAETSEDSFFASWVHHRTERVDDGTNSLKFVCWVVFPVRAPQPSDVRCNERSQVSKGKFDIDDDVTVKSKFCQRVSQLVSVYTTWEGIQRKVSWRPRIALYT